MADTFTQIHIQVVFAVRARQCLIANEHNDEIQKYMTGIVSNLGSKLIAINNMPEHFHLMIGLKPTMALSDLVGKVKSGSSGFINEKRWVRGRFEWQAGFGGFSYARSQLDNVIRYVVNQPERHQRVTFMEEYRELLDEFGIEYDEKYLFVAAE